MPTANPQMKLLIAVYNNDLDAVKNAINEGAQLEYRYNQQQISTCNYMLEMDDVTPLMFALNTSDDTIPEYLISQNADPAARCHKGYRTPLHSAMIYRLNPAILQTMLERAQTLDLRLENGDYLLDSAIDHRHLAGIELLLKAGTSPNQFNPEKEPPLYRLSCKSRRAEDAITREKIARLLLDHGADMRIVSKHGNDIQHCSDGNLGDYYAKYYEMLTRSLASSHKLPPLALDGQPTPELLQICGAGLLPHIFTQERWHGREDEACERYDQLNKLLPPYYKPHLAAEVDMSALHSDAVENHKEESAVKRYVRPRSDPRKGIT